MHKKINLICGQSSLKPDFQAIGNDPNFVFENDPDFQTIRLFDISENIVNVNSWLECAHYVNGGWTDNISDFQNGEKLVFFSLFAFTLILYLLNKKYKLLNKV